MAWVFRYAKRHSRLVGDEKAIFNHVKHKRFEYGDMASSNLRGGAMDVAAELPLQDGDMRPVRSEKQPRTTRRDRMEAKHRHQVHPVRHVDGLGMRASTALIGLTCLGFVLMFLFVADYAKVSSAQKQVDDLQQRMTRCNQNVEILEQKYEAATAGTNVAYEAKRHGLISSKSVPATELYVTSEAVISPADAVLELPKDTLATILGD